MYQVNIFYLKYSNFYPKYNFNILKLLNLSLIFNNYNTNLKLFMKYTLKSI
jgi:hypothetical protein